MGRTHPSRPSTRLTSVIDPAPEPVTTRRSKGRPEGERDPRGGGTRGAARLDPETSAHDLQGSRGRHVKPRPVPGADPRPLGLGAIAERGIVVSRRGAEPPQVSDHLRPVASEAIGPDAGPQDGRLTDDRRSGVGSVARPGPNRHSPVEPTAESVMGPPRPWPRRPLRARRLAQAGRWVRLSPPGLAVRHEHTRPGPTLPEGRAPAPDVRSARPGVPRTRWPLAP